jgi:hypothetical protein
MIDEAGARLTLVDWRGFDKYSVVFEKDDSMIPTSGRHFIGGVSRTATRSRTKDCVPRLPTDDSSCGHVRHHRTHEDVENVSALLDSLARKWQGDALLPQPTGERRMRSLRNRASSRVSDKKRASSEEKARFTLYPYCAGPPKLS